MCGLDTKTLELIESCFKKYPEIVWVKIYGSHAKGNYRHCSNQELKEHIDCVGVLIYERTKL